MAAADQNQKREMSSPTTNDMISREEDGELLRRKQMKKFLPVQEKRPSLITNYECISWWLVLYHLFRYACHELLVAISVICRAGVGFERYC
jgi:hypothetical protein